MLDGANRLAVGHAGDSIQTKFSVSSHTPINANFCPFDEPQNNSLRSLTIAVFRFEAAVLC